MSTPPETDPALLSATELVALYAAHKLSPVEAVQATLARIEQRYIEMALERTSGVQTRAAELLKVSFRQFRYKLRKHSLRALSRFARSG